MNTLFLPEYKMNVFSKIISQEGSPLIVNSFQSFLHYSFSLTLKIVAFGQDPFTKMSSFMVVWEACGDHQKNCHKRSQRQ